MTAYAAHLRIYEPLAAFEEAERRQWAAYVAAGSALDREAGAELEHTRALAALTGRTPCVLPDVAEHAFVLDVDGRTLVCPWRTAARSASALVELRAELPDVLVDAAVPPGLVDTAEQDLRRQRAAHPERRVHVLTSTWQVPLRWFVLFDPAEREVRGGAPARQRHSGGAPAGRRTGRSLVYRTEMSRARRRVARALAVLRRTLDQEAVTDAVEDLGRWLEEFHPRSAVELDYGGLVHLQDDDDLEQDTSARDIAVALAALGEGRTERASAAYTRVTERMKALQAVESAN